MVSAVRRFLFQTDFSLPPFVVNRSDRTAGSESLRLLAFLIRFRLRLEWVGAVLAGRLG